ncbi:formiminoglutamate deiminase [Nocardioides albertanoniae]|uniref:Formiminoglutamate deiminase n=1 Tax=Nocardioides albertanoniae TaxID=1175486 RepID=A0A543A600_9ACTN|nr:formimidoylglutamate deiminase [Nocardioides albertanoniae]TQL68022.1 formiminoglutamate deiminase [Nocardioides albertanoniae]
MSERQSYLLERAILPDGVADEVLVTVADGRFETVTPGFPGHDGAATRLAGLTVAGLANCHSHAFHRALRGRTQRGRGTFWTWREQMYAAAQRLDPDSYFALARAVYREMAATGITCVGEFHYLHHQPDGTPYADPNAMGEALIEAAREAGIRITLLDTLYLAAGIGTPPEGVQRRFSDGDADTWAQRVSRLEERDGVLVGRAMHSVRAVPRDQLRPAAGRPLHVHLSEQRAENEQCLAAYGMTPTELLAEEGLLGAETTAVHATHLTETDIRLLGEAAAYADFCPTTERDLGDGIGPSRALHEAGARLTLGSDSHAVIDLFEEMRAVELDERLVTEQRGHWSAGELLAAATATGHQSLGWSDTGRIAVGQRADLVTLSTTSPRTAGTGSDESSVVFAACGDDVTHVVADGKIVARAGDRQEIGDELATAIGEVWA